MSRTEEGQVMCREPDGLNRRKLAISLKRKKSLVKAVSGLKFFPPRAKPKMH
jgi:hypothetical protein